MEKTFFKEYFNNLLGEAPVKDDSVDYAKPKPVKEPPKTEEPKEPKPEKEYKKKAYKATKVEVGNVYFDKANSKPGYYNYRKVMEINGKTVVVAVSDSDGRVVGNSYNANLSYVQDCLDDPKRSKHDKEEERNAMAFNFLKEIGRVKGGDLRQQKVRVELRAVLAKLKEVAEKFKTNGFSTPAGPNSQTFRASHSGVPITIVYNDVHRGGYYGSNTMFAVQVQVGGGIGRDAQAALMQVAKEILSKFSYETDLGKSGIRTTDGTNWDSVMITAPSKNNMYSPLQKD